MGKEANWDEVRDKKSKWMTFGLELDGFQAIEIMQELGVLPTAEDRILELGFGYGRFLNGYIMLGGEAEYVGIDIAKHWVEENEKKFGDYEDTKFIHGDMLNEKIYEDLGKFDLILGLGVFGCVFPNFGELLELLKGVVKDNGRICFTVIERRKAEARADRYGKLYRRSYDPDEIRQLVWEHGWDIEDSRLVKYQRGIHTRKMYVLKLRDAKPRQVLTSKTSSTGRGRRVGIYLDSLNRVTGGHKRRINMALELQERNWEVALLVRNFSRSKDWRGLPVGKIRMEKADDCNTRDWIMMGDDRFQFRAFCRTKVKAGKVWMFQGMRAKPSPELEITWRNPAVRALCFSTWMKNEVEEKFRRPAIKAIGGVDPKFFYPNKEVEKENMILTTKVHFIAGRKDNTLKDAVKRAAKESGWVLEEFRGTEENIRKQLWRAGLVVSLRGDIEGYAYRDWNNPIAEGMATATPGILLRTGGTGDIAEHKKTAYVIPVRNEIGDWPDVDPEEVYKGVRWMIEHEKSRRRIARAGYNRIKMFSYKNMIDIVEREILNAVGNRGDEGESE